MQENAENNVVEEKAHQNNKRNIAILVVIVFVVLVIAFAFMVSAPQTPSTLTTSSKFTTSLTPTTTINVTPYMSNAYVQNFTSKYVPPTTIGNVSNMIVAAVPSCGITYYYKYILNGLQSQSAIANYSLLNKSRPFAVYFEFGVINPLSLESYSSTLTRKGGYCNPTTDPIMTNSTFSYKMINFSNLNGSSTQGYLTQFSNFTAQGLNLTYTYYTGMMPNISWYFTSVLYKNVEVKVAFWGFTGHMNTSQLISYTNSALQALESSQNGA
jgi:hypothetical protein